jgi:hypothetical protein
MRNLIIEIGFSSIKSANSDTETGWLESSTWCEKYIL